MDRIALQKSRYAAVILAAGFSSRMNAFKPLLPFGEQTAVEVLGKTALAAGLSPVLIISGHGREQLAADIERWSGGLAGEPGAVREVCNEDYPEGMFTSIRKGIETLEEAQKPQMASADAESLRGCFVMPVDCPLIGAETIETMITALEESGGNDDTADRAAGGPADCFAAPTYRGKKGHPLYVPRRFWQEILQSDGAGGLNTITYRHPEEMLRIPVEHEGVVMDMDDRDGYEALEDYYENGSGPSLLELAAGRRFIFVRHGEIEQHASPIFLGSTDVPLSERGILQARQAAEQLRTLGCAPARLYTSPLSRAVQTAEEIAGAFGGAEDAEERGGVAVEAVPGLREMALGSWDGLPVSEVRERFPEAYAARGRDLFAFKIDGKAENFFDMQYRAVKALKEILRKDPAEEIYLVSHKGVLRALENNLRGGQVEDGWEPMEVGGVRVVQC